MSLKPHINWYLILNICTSWSAYVFLFFKKAENTKCVKSHYISITSTNSGACIFNCTRAICVAHYNYFIFPCRDEKCFQKIRAFSCPCSHFFYLAAAFLNQLVKENTAASDACGFLCCYLTKLFILCVKSNHKI